MVFPALTVLGLLLGYAWGLRGLRRRVRKPAPSAREVVRIDLRPMYAPLLAQVRSSIEQFVAQHPTVAISTIVLWGNGYLGQVCLHFDTPANAAATLARWPDWFREDEAGRFDDSCADYAHWVGEYTLPGFPDLGCMAMDKSIEFVALDGTVLRDVDEEGCHAALFSFLEALLREVEPFAGVVRAEPFRIGVLMHEGEIARFRRV